MVAQLLEDSKKRCRDNGEPEEVTVSSGLLEAVVEMVKRAEGNIRSAQKVSIAAVKEFGDNMSMLAELREMLDAKGRPGKQPRRA